MFKTIKSLHSLQFPVYVIPSGNWDIIDGIVFVDGQAVDDLNKPGHSIGIRRLQSNRDFLKLRNPLFLLSDLIHTKKHHFIDSAGTPFTYVKGGFQKLKYKQIDKIVGRGEYSFVWVHGITIPFEIPRPPTDQGGINWSRILYYKGFPWMLYDFQHYQGRDSRVKV